VSPIGADSATPARENRRARFEGAFVDVVAIAGSLGSSAALSRVLGELPAAFPAAIVVVVHLVEKSSLTARDILQRTALATKFAEDAEALQAGVVYIAPPGRHLLVNPNSRLSLTASPRLHYVRPSADLLFESVGATCGERAIGVVLTGMGHDGATGIKGFKRSGGTVIVQDEPTSLSWGMPGAAVHTGCVDFILPLGEIPSTLVGLVTLRDQWRGRAGPAVSRWSPRR